MGRKFTLFAIGLVLLAVGLFPGLAGQVIQAQEARPVLAFYYGWFNGGTWGDGRLADRPAEPYDSADRGAMARQISQAQSAGIDAFVMSWYGPANGTNTAIFQGLLDQAASQGFRVAADVDLGAAEFNATPDATLNTMRDLIANKVNHPGYYRYQGKPVIFFWNQGRFTPDQWAAIRAQVDPTHNTIWVVEGDALPYLNVFDALHLYNIAWSRNAASTAQTWAQRARQNGALFVGTAMPGWDDTRMGRGDAAFAVDRGNGAFYRAMFSGAASANPDMLIITSWNEYFENTHLEPSQGLGAFYLDLTRELIAEYKGTAAVAAPEGGQLAPVPVGIAAIPQVEGLNIRQTPATDAPILALATGGTEYPIVGRSADGSWWLIDFGGGQGWITASYAMYVNGDINAVPVR
ncbi:endo-1,3-alpha-glucanase family glycosylhydrolase [Chloroflexota bacterium]